LICLVAVFLTSAVCCCHNSCFWFCWISLFLWLAVISSDPLTLSLVYHHFSDLDHVTWCCYW